MGVYLPFPWLLKWAQEYPRLVRHYPSETVLIKDDSTLLYPPGHKKPLPIPALPHIAQRTPSPPPSEGNDSDRTRERKKNEKKDRERREREREEREKRDREREDKKNELSVVKVVKDLVAEVKDFRDMQWLSLVETGKIGLLGKVIIVDPRMEDRAHDGLYSWLGKANAPTTWFALQPNKDFGSAIVDEIEEGRNIREVFLAASNVEADIELDRESIPNKTIAFTSNRSLRTWFSSLPTEYLKYLREGGHVWIQVILDRDEEGERETPPLEFPKSLRWEGRK